MIKKNKKKERKNKRWEKVCNAALPVGYWLLDALCAMDEMFPDPFEGPRRQMWRFSNWPKEVRISRLKHEFKRMKDRGWIEDSEKQGKKFLKLTKKGRLHAWYRKIEGLAPPSKAQWNRKWVAVFFDIPEKGGRAERDAIRRTLMAAGFYRLQKSVYIYPDDIPADVINYLTEAELLSFIRFARIEQIDNDRDLKKFFNFSNPNGTT